MTENEETQIRINTRTTSNLAEYMRQPEKLKVMLEALELLIDKEPKIIFDAYGDRNITDLKTLVVGLFYKSLTTIYAHNKLTHCEGDRRRSLIDFYILQKHYLAEPLNIHECADIYFNVLFRGDDKRYERYPDMGYTAQMIDNAKITNKFYYCSTVRRNVLQRLDNIECATYKNMLKELEKINRPLKQIKEKVL